MKIRDIEDFFKEVDKRIDFPIRVVLTGGAAGIVFGTDRATQDIDFEVNLVRENAGTKKWETLQQVLEKVSTATKITPQYADDIDRWSSIALPLKKSQLVKKIGKVEVRILEPSLWAIGKLTRFLESDQSDLVTVLKTKKTDARLCAKMWGKALRLSPPSPMQSVFRRQVENFFDQYGKSIWGSSADTEDLKGIFRKEASAKAPRK